MGFGRGVFELGSRKAAKRRDNVEHFSLLFFHGCYGASKSYNIFDFGL